MTSSILGGFFQQTGGKSISWKDREIGFRQGGTIKALNEPSQQTNPEGELLFDKKSGRPKMQVRIDLDTEYRDPGDPDDDGSRSLYVKGWMTGAVGDALRKAGVADPAVGGQLWITLSGKEPSKTPGYDPINKFTAEYTPPSPAAGYFSEQSAPQSPPAAVAAGAAAAAEPPRPSAITEAAWKTMDLATKINLAATMGAAASDEPPF